MRQGTVLEYNLPSGKSAGVVSHLLDENSVTVIDKSGAHYLIIRGIGHKRDNQYDDFSDGLRSKFGITVGPCQKETFGAQVVTRAKLQSKKRTTLPVMFPIPISTPDEAIMVRKRIKLDTVAA